MRNNARERSLFALCAGPFEIIMSTGLLSVESSGLQAVPLAEDPRTGLSVLGYLAIFLFAAVLLFTALFIYRHILAKAFRTSLKEDYQKEAEAHEKSGRFVSAASIYEHQLKNGEKAAELYEKGADYRSAAILYNLLGMPDKAKELYEKDGDHESAAAVSLLEGNYEEAAKLFDSAGDKINSAMMLEKAGRKMAAVRIYREAGEYQKASELLEEEGMLREAAEMFGIFLRDKKTEEFTDNFYEYALKLERAGEHKLALEVFMAIDHINPHFRDVRVKIASLAPAGEEDRGTTTTLRNFIRSGKLEPRHALKLWLHILKALQKAYEEGKAHGSLSPDTIAIDVHNTISFLSKPVSSVYSAPENLQGSSADVCSDIYSAGIILYEMLLGSLDGLGFSRIVDTTDDVPEWLDDIVLRCIRKVRGDRYQNLEMIFSDVKALSDRKKIAP